MCELLSELTDIKLGRSNYSKWEMKGEKVPRLWQPWITQVFDRVTMVPVISQSTKPKPEIPDKADPEAETEVIEKVEEEVFEKATSWDTEDGPMIGGEDGADLTEEEEDWDGPSIGEMED